MTGKTIIYMDHAAATPMDPMVLEAMGLYFADTFYNPSAAYSAAFKTRQALNDSRSKVAHWLGAKSSEVIFTAGGTEANNLAIKGIMEQYPKGNIVISSIEHESILVPAANYNYRQTAVKPDGRLNLDDLKEKIDNNTVMVSVMYANNEIGTIQPIREIAKIVQQKQRERTGKAPLPLYFHTDACQAANYLDLHAVRLGIDLLTLNAGKIYGPKQAGALYVKAGTILKPLIEGGGQERGLRSGTENVAAASGLATALNITQSMRRDESKRLQSLQKEFIELLKNELPEAVINGSEIYRLPNNIHLTLPGSDNERLLIQLDEDGIIAAAGSACSADSGTPSHVLEALGLTDAQARSSLRFTMGRGTTSAMVRRVVAALSAAA